MPNCDCPDARRYALNGLIGSSKMRGTRNNASVEYGPSEVIHRRDKFKDF